jgi:hypothetical protein
MNPIHAAHHLGHLQILEVFLISSPPLSDGPRVTLRFVTSVEMLVETRNDGIIVWLNNRCDEPIVDVVSAPRIVWNRFSPAPRIRDIGEISFFSFILEPSSAAHGQRFVLILGLRHNAASNAQ